MNGTVVFYPYRYYYENSYIYMMQSIIAKNFEIIDYEIAKKMDDLQYVRCLYLNWIESAIDSDDKSFISQMKQKGSKIVWVFHNRFPHDSYGNDKLRSNMEYMCQIADIIVLHSHKSDMYLEEYGSRIVARRVFVPHINFIGTYEELGRFSRELSHDTFVFSSLGLIRPYKNIELLISAFNTLSDKCNAVLLIAGEAKTQEYIRELNRLKNGNKKIIIHSGRISSLEMGTYLRASDVLVFPYDTRSGMNSGAMIMGFSYGKTAIVSRIAMADEYSDKLIYKYSYNDDEDHIRQLSNKLFQAYSDGKYQTGLKGKELHNIVEVHNSKEEVTRKILEVLG